MNFFQKFFFWLKSPRTYQQRQQEWASRFKQPPANPKYPTPLDPGNDPWRT